MADDDNTIVSGPPKWRWPWRRDPEIEIGSQTREPDSPVASPERARMRLPRLRRGQSRVAPPTWLASLLVTVVVLAAFVFHAAPHVARMGGMVGAQDARGLLVHLADFIPVFGDIDPARWLVPGASAWLWQPLPAAFGAAVLRMVALNTAGRDPVLAIWIAAVALAVDTATWLLMGLKLEGAYSATEAETLVALLRVEGVTLLVLLILLAPTGKKRSGQTAT